VADQRGARMQRDRQLLHGVGLEVHDLAVRRQSAPVDRHPQRAGPQRGGCESAVGVRRFECRRRVLAQVALRVRIEVVVVLTELDEGATHGRAALVEDLAADRGP
jgi:hypothetical protein